MFFFSFFCVVMINSYFSDSPLTIMPNLTSAENEINSNNGTTENNYYKYSVFSPKPYINTTNEVEYEIINVNLTSNITLNLGNVTEIPKDELRYRTKEFGLEAFKLNTSDVERNDKRNENNVSMPDFNDLKFKEWSRIKLFKNSRLLNKMFNDKTRLDSINTTNVSNLNDTVLPKTFPKDIVRILTPSKSRFNRTKIVNTSNSRRSFNNTKPSTFHETIYHKIDGLQNVLKKLLKELRKNNTVKVKPKRFNIGKYLKKFFRKIFRKRKGKGMVTANDKALFNHHIIDTICENFRDCDRSQINNPVLNRKIKELYPESLTVLKTIQIIKGLLHLIDFPKEESPKVSENLANLKSKSNFKDDIRKLNAILKGRYTSNRKLTATEKIQIEYIKRNTRSFIQFVARFANKLSDVISILTKNVSHSSRPIARAKVPVTREIKKNKNKVNSAYIDKVKGILEKFSLIQLNLVQNMAHSLVKLQRMPCDKTKGAVIQNNKNSTDFIVRYANNIVKNLKKLKDLAQTLSLKNSAPPSDGHLRRKREAMKDEEAMEYLLTLMEYLLKQNHHLDVAPGMYMW